MYNLPHRLPTWMDRKRWHQTFFHSNTAKKTMIYQTIFDSKYIGQWFYALFFLTKKNLPINSLREFLSVLFTIDWYLGPFLHSYFNLWVCLSFSAVWHLSTSAFYVKKYTLSHIFVKIYSLELHTIWFKILQ